MLLSIRNVFSKNKKLLIDNQSHDIFGRSKVAFSFEERALLLAEESDIVVLRKILPPKYVEFVMGSCNFRVIYLKSNNEEMDLSEVILEEKNLHILKQLIEENNDYNYTIQSYIPDKGIDLVSKKLRIPISGYDFFVNNCKKSQTQNLCNKLGLKTVTSIYLQTHSDIYDKNVLSVIKKYKKVIVKPDFGMGGDSMFVLETNKLPESKVSLSFPILIQELMRLDREGSIQFIRFSNKWSICLCETYQSNFKYYGFRFPFCTPFVDEFVLTSKKIFDYFYDRYDNISSFGIDFIISDGKVYYHDINPRNTAATYIFSLIIRLYGYGILNSVELEYLQIEYKCEIEYYKLRYYIEKEGLKHISRNNAEGFALIYPGMLKNKLINVIFVSQSHKIDEYRQLFFIVTKKYI